MGEKVASRVWNNSKTGDDLLHFSRQYDVDLSNTHPEPVLISMLRQSFLDNVNPLLKIVHAPTMQSEIIEALGDLTSVSSVQVALMFSIYCVAVHSLNEEECLAKLGQQKKVLLVTYRLGCRQALVETDCLRSHDRNSLIALCLCLASLQMSKDGVFSTETEKLGEASQYHEDSGSSASYPFRNTVFTLDMY
jgi:hypothetical protein